MASDTDLLNNIPKGKPVRIFLPLLNRQERARAQCLYQETEPPEFSLIFKPGVLPIEELDVQQPCIISIDMGGPTISLEARIKKIANRQTLQMEVENAINHEQMREFFRVDAVTSVISKSFHTELFSDTNEPWSTKGQTIDISGSGLLAIFEERPLSDKQVRLEITIPSFEQEIIKVLAHEVRTQQMHDGRYEVAYHFVDISTEDRDKIIGCCLVIQRKMLRLKVQVKNDQ